MSSPEPPDTAAGVARELFAALDMAAFQWVGGTRFRPLGQPSRALVARFPALAAADVDLPDVFTFLGHVLAEPESAWGETAAPTGLWTETDAHGVPCQLEATLVVVRDRRLLLLELVGRKHEEMAAILQAARDRSLVFEQFEKAQAALAESERRFRTLADGAPVLIWMSDAAGQLEYVNQTWLQFTGRSFDEERGAGWLAGVPAEDRAKVEAALAKHCSEPRRFEIEFRLRRSDGVQRWILNTSLPRFAASGEFVGFTGCATDITERVKAVDILEQRVAERTAELIGYQRRLRSLADQLTQTEERARRRIAQDLHDHIGQNLAVAKIQLGMLGAAVHSDEQQKRITELRAVIDESIQYTRSLTFELASPLLYEVGLEAALESLARSLQERYGFAVGFRDAGPPVAVDERVRAILFQGVRELVHNVAKHASAQSAEIVVSRNHREIAIVVEDDGVGFSQVPGPRRDDRGFGLFNIGERLEQLGGALVLEGRAAGGARVTMRVPVVAPPTSDEPKAE